MKMKTNVGERALDTGRTITGQWTRGPRAAVIYCRIIAAVAGPAASDQDS